MSVDESTSIFLRYSIILLRSVGSTSTPTNLDLCRLRRVYLHCSRRRREPTGSPLFVADNDDRNQKSRWSSHPGAERSFALKATCKQAANADGTTKKALRFSFAIIRTVLVCQGIVNSPSCSFVHTAGLTAKEASTFTQIFKWSFRLC